MRIFGLSISRASETKTLAPVSENRGGWWPLIRDWYPGAWQRNDIQVDQDLVLSYHAVWACMTLIASDIAKLRVKLVEQDANGIWSEFKNPAYDPVLRRPNRYQNRIQFWENWVLSKLIRGNTYVLKQRDQRGVVTALYILDPSRVQVMVADDGSIFYQLQADNLSGLTGPIMVPASEIIHDRMHCVRHPLVGTSPIFANGLAATQGLSIQSNSTRFFGNKSMPGGILTAPGAIGDDTAARLKASWEANFSGENQGKVAVLGDGLTFEPIMMTSVDAQLIEQLRWTAETVCSTFHVPPYKIGIPPPPAYNNVQSLNIEYYSQCLQVHIEAAELCLDEGLAMATGVGTEFDLDGLLRMDTVTQVTAIRDAIGAGFMAPNEGRKKMDLKPVTGGETPYLQEQNFSLSALSKRDALADPWASRDAEPEMAALPAPPDDDDDDTEEKEMLANAYLRKELEQLIAA